MPNSGSGRININDMRYADIAFNTYNTGSSSLSYSHEMLSQLVEARTATSQTVEPITGQCLDCQENAAEVRSPKGRAICKPCRKQYSDCRGCGKTRRLYEMRYCSVCLDKNTFVCDLCSTRTPHDSCSLESPFLCRSCGSNTPQNLSGIFDKYNRTPNWHSKNDPDDKSLYGFELELEFKDQNHAYGLAKCIYENVSQDEISLAYDGSLRGNCGVEIRSHMFGYSAMLEPIEKLRKILAPFKDSDLTSNRLVGIHVSTNFDYIDDSNERSRQVCLFWYLINKCSANWQVLSKREGSRYASYYNVSDVKNVSDIKRMITSGSYSSKYSSVNIGYLDYYSMTGRVEVRTFWRTKNCKELYSYIGALHKLKKFINDTPDSDWFIKTSANDVWLKFASEYLTES